MGIFDEFQSISNATEGATRVIMTGKPIYDAAERKYDNEGNLIVKGNQSVQVLETEPNRITINGINSDKVVPRKKQKVKQKEVKPQSRSIVFRIDGLKDLKMRCLEILETEIGYLVLFENEDQLIYTPEAGDSFEVSTDNVDFIPVFFPGTLFNLAGRVILVVVKNT